MPHLWLHFLCGSCVGSCEGSFKDRMPQWTLERKVATLPAPYQPVLPVGEGGQAPFKRTDVHEPVCTHLTSWLARLKSSRRPQVPTRVYLPCSASFLFSPLVPWAVGRRCAFLPIPPSKLEFHQQQPPDLCTSHQVYIAVIESIAVTRSSSSHQVY